MIWRERPGQWQCSLATLLAVVGPNMAIEWLLEMTECGEDSVTLQAIDELKEMQRELILHWPQRIIRPVRELRERGFTTQQLEQFLDDMTFGRITDTWLAIVDSQGHTATNYVNSPIAKLNCD